MRQLHVEHSQLRHRLECFEYCCESVDCESVVIVFSLLLGSAETQFCQLLNSTQLLDSFVGDTAVVYVICHLLIRTFFNNLELQMLVQRLSSESQWSTVNMVTVGSAASIFPISDHSFERQPTKEMVVTDWEIAAMSETLIYLLLNCMCVHIIGIFFMI
jgi:hypothetical protein